VSQSLGFFSFLFPGLNRYIFPLPSSDRFFLAVGFTRHHTTFGASLSWLCYLLFTKGYLENSSRRDRAWYFWGALCCGVGVLFSFSRGAWLSFLVGLFIVLALLNRKWLFRGAILLSLVLGLLFFTSSSFEQRIRSFHFSENQERFELWQAAWRMFLDSPWFGQGYHSFGARFEAFTDLHVKNPQVPRDTHYMYLDFLATTGALGFTAFISFLISTFLFLKRGWLKLGATDSRRVWFTATLGGFGAFCMGGCFDRYFYMQHTLIPLLLFLSVCAASLQREAKSAPIAKHAV